MRGRVTLGLALLLGFAAVRGETVRCSVGGVDAINCDKLIQDSVLQKYYIFSFQSTSIDNNYDKIDAPFTEFSKLDLSGSLKNSTANGSPKSKSKTSPKSEICLTRDQILKPITLYEFDLSKSFTDAVLNGTDVYRLKFHSNVTKLYMNDGLVTEQDYEVLLCSCYSAASIYFFTKNYYFAWKVLEDGFNIIASFVKKFENVLSESVEQELLIWSVVYQTMKVDLMKYLSYNEQQIAIAENELTEKMNEISKDPLKKYPSQYLLLYRRYFLDKDFDNEKKEKLMDVIKNDLIITKLHDVYMDIHTYHYLTLAEKNANDDVKAFMHLVYAIKRPTLSVEDRLLNYKANQLAYDIVKNCIGSEGWIAYDEYHMCTKIAELRKGYKSLDDILIKYTHMKIYDHTTIMTKLRKTLNDDLINEDLLHSIVTSAIDMDVYDTDVYNAKIENVKEAIHLLELFIKTSYSNNQQQQIKENKLQSVVKAYKWLAELNAVLCSDENTDIYRKKVLEALKAANKISTSNDKLTINNTTNIPQIGVLTPNVDEHLQFLIAKHDCKTVLPYKTWENPKRNDGWIIGTEGLFTSLYHKAIDKQSDCYKKIAFGVDSNNRYIHRVDALIITFRYWHNMRNLYAAQKTIRAALTHIVVTPEDRYRNKEAHELYSMFLLRKNCGDIKNDNNRFRPLPDNEDDNDSYSV